jgi:hypothetical protein
MMSRMGNSVCCSEKTYAVFPKITVRTSLSPKLGNRAPNWSRFVPELAMFQNARRVAKANRSLIKRRNIAAGAFASLDGERALVDMKDRG